MNLSEDKTNILFGVLTIIGSLVVTVACATYFATMKYEQLDGRVSILEQDITNTNTQIQRLSTAIETNKDAQNIELTKFHTFTNDSLSRMEDKIDQTYEIVAFGKALKGKN